YLVLAPDQPAEIEELRGFAKEKLADYMVPAFFVPVENIPLTPNGKIDLRALPSPQTAGPDLRGAFVAPRSETEKKLATMWSELLGREQIGIYDNFFALGGHSILATQVLSRVRDTFQVRLSLRNFFDKPTVAALAELLAGATTEDVKPAPPIIRRLQRDETTSLTPD